MTTPAPVRLADLPEDDSPAGRAGALIRGAQPLPPRPVASRHQVRWRIRATLDGRRQLARRVLRPALVALLLFSGGAVLGVTAEKLRARIQRATASVSHGAWSRATLMAPPPVAEERPGRDDGASAGGPGAVVAPVIAPAASALAKGAGPGESRAGGNDRRGARRSDRVGSAGARRVAANRAGEGATGGLSEVTPGPLVADPPANSPLPTPPPGTTAANIGGEGATGGLTRGARGREVAAAQATSPLPSPPPRTVAERANDRLDEQALFARALHQLRGVGDARGALADLDRMEQQFPGGMFAPEAAELRAEALTLLRRNGEALRVAGAGSPAELVVRGELHLSLRQFREAAADFDRALDAGVPPSRDDAAVLGRALWGRAQARAQLGDRMGARRDLEEYVRRFPEGRFAEAAGRALGRSR